MTPEHLQISRTESGKPVISINRREIRRNGSSIYPQIESLGIAGLAPFCRDLSTEPHIFGINMHYLSDQVIIAFANPIFKTQDDFPDRNNEMLAKRKFSQSQQELGRSVLYFYGNYDSIDSFIEDQEQFIRNYGWNPTPKTLWRGWIKYE